MAAKEAKRKAKEEKNKPKIKEVIIEPVEEKLTERQRKKLEIQRIMRLPEVKDDLLNLANPNEYNMYKVAF